MILDSIKSHIQAAGVAGGETGWGLFTGFLPDTPDKSVAIFELPGGEPETLSENETLSRVEFQVRVRGAERDYQSARTKIQEIFDILHNQPVSGFIYVFAIQSGPMPLGNDRQDRPNLTQNYKTSEV